jgi:hypothetical protein
MTVTTSRPLWLASADSHISASLQVTPEKAPFSAEDEAAIGRYWDERRAANPRLFDGPVWAVRGWSLRDAGHLELRAYISSYKYVLYTHFGSTGNFESFKALGASAITRTSDGFVVLGLRSGAVATTPHTWHFAPAGNVDRADLASLMASELSEELGIERWRDFRVFGLFDAGKEQGHKTEIVFLIDLHETLAEVQRSFAALGDHEHAAVDGRREFPENLNLTEVAAAALKCYYGV